MSNLRIALRVLSRSPLLTLVVVLSLGLGIGANTAIFSLLYQVLLRSLPIENPQELVFLKFPGEFKSGRDSTNSSGGQDSIFSYKMFRGLEKRHEGVSGIAGFRLLSANLSFRNQTVDGSLTVVSGGYFPILGVKPRIGRLITYDDDVPGGGRPVAVLSNSYWQNKLGSRSDVLNQPLRVNGQIFTIVGIAPEGFTGTTFGDQPDVFVPLSFKPLMTPGWDGTDKWSDYWMYLFARLSPGMSRQQAEAGMNIPYHALVAEQLKEKQVPDASDRERFLKSKLTLVDGRLGQSQSRDSSQLPLLILMASTVLVLLIAVANSANLLLARAAQRKKELAIRAALGASRTNIAGQMLTEALLLSFGGGLAGLLFASWTVHLLVLSFASDGGAQEYLTAQLDWVVLLFAFGISMASGLLCGMYPAWEAARSSVNKTLRDQSGQTSASVGAARVRKGLVCAQVAVSALLLIPTGLFLKSLLNLLRVDLGVKSENLITFHVSPELSGYKPPQSRALFERSEAKLAAIPGVTNVTSALVPLIAGDNWGSSLTVEGYSTDQKADVHSMYNTIGGGYFGKLGIPLIAGREFSDRDTLAGPKVTVVNEQFVKHFFGGRNPIGRKIVEGRGNVVPNVEIVGVVKDSHYSGVKQTPPRVFYTPWRQSKNVGTMTFYVRTALPTDQVIPQIRSVMKSLDSDLPVENLRTFEEQVRMNIRSDQMVLQLSAAFAVLATVLAMLGLYGVMAYSVTRRTREIGIRIALGAQSGTIRSMVMREVFLILGIGLMVGIPGAIVLARLAQEQLYGVKSFDGGVVAGSVLALAVAALMAGYLPARRATRIESMIALRHE
jgi:putative ABC transport system permease protein